MPYLGILFPTVESERKPILYRSCRLLLRPIVLLLLKCGLTWKEFDVNWVQLRMLEKLGLATNVYAYDLETESEAPQELRIAA